MEDYPTSIEVEDLQEGIRLVVVCPSGEGVFYLRDDMAVELIENISYIVGDIQ